MVPMEEFAFDHEKLLQTMGYILKKSGGKTRVLRLAFMVRIADYEYFLEEGEPITGDWLAASEYGMAMKVTVALAETAIQGDPCPDPWNRYFRPYTSERQLTEVEMIADPGDDMLCAAAREKLDSICDRFGQMMPIKVGNYFYELMEWYELKDMLEDEDKLKDVLSEFSDRNSEIVEKLEKWRASPEDVEKWRATISRLSGDGFGELEALKEFFCREPETSFCIPWREFLRINGRDEMIPVAEELALINKRMHLLSK